MGERPPAGFILADKPAGVTSHDVVARIRRETGLKTGHAGTLDPFATGLLVVLLGQATRLQRYVMGRPKTYLATARLGWRSSTGDRDGELTRGRQPASLEIPVGLQHQTVPMTSAVRVDGERLYKRAHRGEHTEERPAREIEVYRAELLGADSERARFEIECSAGTYIRVLIEDLGDAYCEELRRTAIGDLDLGDAGPEIHPPERLLTHLGERQLTDAEAVDVVHGRRLTHDPDTVQAPGEPDPGGLVELGTGAKSPATASGSEGPIPEPIRLTHEGRLLAIARPRDGVLKTDLVLA